MSFPYSLGEEYADIIHALALIESGEKTCPQCGQFPQGDGGQARGLLQIHPSRFRDIYGHSARFLADVTDTWIQADIKACAAYLDKWERIPRDLLIQGWRLGINAVMDGQRDPQYLERYTEALIKARANGH